MEKPVAFFAKNTPEAKENSENTSFARSHQTYDISVLTDEEIEAEIQKGFADMESGRTKTLQSVFSNIRKQYEI